MDSSPISSTPSRSGGNLGAFNGANDESDRAVLVEHPARREMLAGGRDGVLNDPGDSVFRNEPDGARRDDVAVELVDEQAVR